jgi:LysM repeat protein
MRIGSSARRLRHAAALALLACVTGCVTSGDSGETSASDAAVSQLRSELGGVDDRVTALDRSVESLKARLAGIERENAEAQASLKAQQEAVQRAVASLATTQRNELDKIARTATQSSAKEVEQLTAKLAQLLSLVQQENGTLQKKVSTDLGTLQKDINGLQAQIVASADRIDRIEQRVKSGSGAAKAPAQSTGETKTPAQPGDTPPVEKAPAQVPLRTGTPSSPDIDYSQGYTHKVSAGETLSKIARDYNVAIQDIINTNPKLTDPARLAPGQELFVPHRKK